MRRTTWKVRVLVSDGRWRVMVTVEPRGPGADVDM